MRRKKQHHEEHVDESWLIPYADVLTLLLALFIVMFAMSKVDQQKFEKLKESFGTVFQGGAGIMNADGSKLVPNLKPDTGKATSTPAAPTVKPSSTPGQTVTPSGNGAISGQAQEQDRMADILKSLTTEIATEGYDEKVKASLQPEGLEITIQDVTLFKSADANVIPTSHTLLMRIADLLDGLDNPIRIIGHTDNLPIRTAQFRSNWDLSAMRAINVMQFLVANAGMKQEQFAILAMGEFQPKYDNATEEGRAKNRRVEILIVRKYPTASATATDAAVSGVEPATNTADTHSVTPAPVVIKPTPASHD